MEWKNVVPDATEKEIEKVIQVYKDTEKDFRGYIAYTDLRKSRMPYPRIFAVIKTLHTRNPYTITPNINRMGENVYVKIHLDMLEKDTNK